MERNVPEHDEVQPEATYEAPRLETVLTPDEVEREVHYAGVPSNN